MQSEESPKLYGSDRLRNKKRPNPSFNDDYSYSDWESDSSHPDDPIVDIHTDSTRHRRPTKVCIKDRPRSTVFIFFLIFFYSYVMSRLSKNLMMPFQRLRLRPVLGLNKKLF